MRYRPKLLLSDYREGLCREDIDLVVICTPHHLHHAMAIDALKAGKHVICEKPMAISVQEADEMIDAASHHNRKLFVMLNMRLWPEHRKLKEMITDNVIGQVFMAKASYLGYEFDRLDDPNDWKGDLCKAGGGVLIDGGYHLVDLVNSCLGKACYVQAAGGQYIINATNKGEDNISLMIEYAGGAVANLQISFTACNYGCHIEPTLMMDQSFLGSDGSLFCHYGWDTVDIRKGLELVRPNARETLNLDGIAEHVQCGHFVNCLQTGEHPIVTCLDARNTTAVVEAAYESLRSGRRTPVNWRDGD